MFHIRLVAVFTLLLGFYAEAQVAPDSEVFHPNQRVIVANLPLVTAKDSSSSALAKAAVGIVLGSTKTECDSGSQLESVIDSNAGASLSALISKVDGATCSSGGQIKKVNASFTPNSAIVANNIIASILQQKPLLIQWKGAVYVLYGVVYDQHLHQSGTQDNVVREFLLLDPRYRDKRRFTVFDSKENDFGEVEGVATVSVG
jgi:hypothetical protein